MTRPVTDILREINKGRFVEEVTDELSRLVPACRAAGAAGEIVIKLKLKPGRNGSNVVEVIPSFSVKKPRAEAPTEIFFATTTDATGTCTLLRDNPDQGQLDLKVVKPEAVPLAVVERGAVPIRMPVAGAPVRELVDPSTGEVVRVQLPADPAPVVQAEPPRIAPEGPAVGATGT